MKKYLKNSFFLKFFNGYYKLYILILIITFISTGMVYLYPLCYTEILKLAREKNVLIILRIFIFLILISVFLFILDYIKYKLYYTTNNQVILKCKIYIFDKLLNSKMELYNNFTDSEILSRLESDVNDVVNTITEIVISVITYIFSLVVLSLLMFKLFPTLCMIILFISFLMIIFTKLFSKLIYKRQKVLMEKLDENKMYIWETLKGVSEISILGRKERRKKVYQEQNEDAINKKIQLSMDLIVSNKVVNLLGVFCTILIYVIGSIIIIKNPNQYSLEVIIALASYGQLFISDIIALASVNIDYSVLKVLEQRIQEIIDFNYILKGEKNVKEINKIRLENVNFSYGEKSILREVNFEICKGDKIAIVGKNGSGKSTLIKLVLNLYSVESGNIYINEYNSEEVNLDSFYSRIGVVSQNPVLFNGTVSENIDFQDNKLSDELLNILGIDVNFLKKNVGFMGESLSAGEKQKVAIMRCLSKNCDIYILDEVNNHLDKNSLKNIRKYIFERSNEKILICITHNETELEIFDKKFLLEDGILKDICGGSSEFV